MTVRIHILVRAATIFSQGTDPKARAMGYSHSYLDPETAELISLAAFPTDEEIEITAGEAWEEAVALLDLLGIQYADITSPQTTPGTKSGDPAGEVPDPDEASNEEHDHDHDSQMETEAGALQYLIDIQRSPEWDAVDEEARNTMHTLTCAATALDIEDQEEL